MISFLRFSLLSFCFAATQLFAQNKVLLTTIPKQSLGVVTFHGGVLQRNIDINELNKSEFILKLQREFARELGNESAIDSNFIQLLGNLDDKGVNTASNSYLYFTMDSAFITINYLMEVNNEQQFSAFASDYVAKEKQISLPSLKGAKGYKVKSTNSVLTWNNQQANLVTYIENSLSQKKNNNAYDFMDNYNYDIDYDSLAAAEELQRIEEEKVMEAQIIKRVSNTYNTITSPSILEAPGFLTSLKQEGDITFWGQNTALWQLDNIGLLYLVPSIDRYADPVITRIKSLYEDAYMTGNVKFTESGIMLDVASYTNSNVAKYSKMISNSRFEKSLLSYIPNDYVACYAATFNPSAITPITKEFLYPIIQSVPEFGSRVTDVLDIIDIFVDEKAIYDLIEGDFAVFFSGMAKVQADSTYYEYDEDFNYEMKTASYEKTIPKVTFLLSTKNESIWQKIINLPSLIPFYVNNNGIYEFEKEGVKAYFAVKNGVVIITSDQALVTTHLINGLPKESRLSGDNLKEITSTNNFLKVTKTTLDIEDKDYVEFQRVLDKVKFESVMYSGGQMKGNASLGHVEIKFGDKKQNVVNFLVGFIDELMALDNNNSDFEMEEELDDEVYEVGEVYDYDYQKKEDPLEKKYQENIHIERVIEVEDKQKEEKEAEDFYDEYDYPAQ